jgi:hypothetical protein
MSALATMMPSTASDMEPMGEDPGWHRPCASSGNPHAALKELTETAGTLSS